LGGFMKCLGVCNAYIAELWRVFEGLQMARGCGVQRASSWFSNGIEFSVEKKGDSLFGWSLIMNC